MYRDGAFIGTTDGLWYLDASLINGEIHAYAVSAVNVVGEGARSAEATATPMSVPGAPSGLSAQAGDGHVVLSWTAPANGGSAIIRYVIYRGTDLSSMVPLGNTTATTYDDTTAVNGQTYHYSVVAENGVGAGEKSAAVSATPTAGSEPVVQVRNDLDPLVQGAIAALIIAAVLGAIFFLRRRRI